MPDEGLAAVVLEAARKEKAKNEGQSALHGVAGGSGEGSGSTDSSSSNPQLKHVNGHLAPPFEWTHQGSNRTFTDSPEPLAAPQLFERDYINVKSDGSSPARKVHQSQPPAPKRRMSSQIFSSGGTRATHSRERQIYTSQSSGDDYDSAPGGSSSKAHGDRNKVISGNGQLNNGHAVVGKSSTSSDAPMRGPFSRLDSSRGESNLAQRGASDSSSRSVAGPNAESGGSASRTGNGHNYGAVKGVPTPLRRMSTGGYDNRRQSMSATARRMMSGFFGGEAEEQQLETDGDGNASERDDGDEDLRRARSFNRSQSLLRVPKSQPNQSRSRDSSPSVALQRRTSDRSASYNRLRRPRSEDFANRNEAGGGTGNGVEAAAGPHGARPGVSRYKTEGIRFQARDRWDALRQRMRQEKKSPELEKGLTGSELITDLSSGLMSVIMLKMAFDRDEHNQHRVGQFSLVSPKEA